ncbi:unnamed protein product [Polarella glacialis]|nr:unnamed protein product [Polarella glacialis]
MLIAEKALCVAAVVSRWYGGVHLGPARFQHIRESARTLLQLCGHRPNVPMLEQRSEWGLGHQLNPGQAQPVDDAAARREAMAAAAERRALASAHWGCAKPAVAAAARTSLPRQNDSQVGKRPVDASVSNEAKEDQHKELVLKRQRVLEVPPTQAPPLLNLNFNSQAVEVAVASKSLHKPCLQEAVAFVAVSPAARGIWSRRLQPGNSQLPVDLEDNMDAA